MPNWCANRLMFSGIKDRYALKTWITGGELSLNRRAKRGDSAFPRGLCRDTASPDGAGVSAISTAGFQRDGGR